MTEEVPQEESRGAVVDLVTKTFDPWLESKRHSNILIIGFLLLACIPLIGIGLATTRTILPYDRLRSIIQLPIGASDAVHSLFTCSRGKSIVAVFSTDSVELTLSDGRHLTLPQTRSASGARYANPDESFVFWNKGNTAFVQEDGITTYTGCVTKE